MRKLLSIIAFLTLFAPLHAQVLMNRDSLLRLVPMAKKDTNAVLLYINIGQQYESNQPETAKQYYRMAGELSRIIHYPRGIIKYITNYTFILNMQGLYDSSLILNQQSVALSRQIKDSLYLAKTLFNTGTSYRSQLQYEKAVVCYEEGKKIFALLGNTDVEGQANDILQVLYNMMKQYNRAIEYGEKAVAALSAENNLPWLGMALNNLGLSYVATKKFDKATALFKQALEIAYKIGDKNMEKTQYLNLASGFLQQDEFETMKPYMDKALALAKELGSRESELIALKGLSYYHTYKKDYRLAQRYAEEALSLSYQFDFKNQREKVFAQLSNLAYAMQDIHKGEYYAVQSSDLADSLLNETVQKNALELEKQYETAKKESQIKALETDKQLQEISIRQKNILNYILVAAAVVLLLISLLLYRNYKQKQILQQQRITELETEKKLTATEAVLKGEEQERTRLAKDLHDGLGGMLSGIKYAFQNMKGNLVMTPDNAQAFERSMDMLDSSIKEMRRVAHNMMPEVLVKFGLDTALQDFCNDINQSGILKVTYQSVGLENAAIDQTTAITMYRIVQELMNNTLKHAAAKSSIVQVEKANGEITLTVEDDGKGFDPAILQKSKGIGWSNIQSRVDFLKGTLDVRSSENKGTSVLIELKA